MQQQNNAHLQGTIPCDETGAGLVIIDETNGPSPLPHIAVARQPRKVADFVVPFPPAITAEQLVFKERKNGTVPSKAMNKFFVYRRWCVMQLKLQGHQYPMTDVSGIISQHWTNEPASVKTYYENLAKEANKLYRKLYPVPPKLENKTTTTKKERRKKCAPYQIPTPLPSPTATDDSDQQQARGNYKQEPALLTPVLQQPDVLFDDLVPSMPSELFSYGSYAPLQTTEIAPPLPLFPNLCLQEFAYPATTTPPQFSIDYSEYDAELTPAFPSPSETSSSGFATPTTQALEFSNFNNLNIDTNQFFFTLWP